MADVSNLRIDVKPSDRSSQSHQTPPVVTSSPRPSRIMVRDITQDFTTAASELSIGQLVKAEHFTLFEAVGALEIMDPKMDSGYLIGTDTPEEDYDVLRELMPEEVLGIMDQLLRFEMAWHMGNPLSQTLFTSLYLDRLLWPEPKSLTQARFNRDEVPEGNPILHSTLRAFCLGLIKSCGLVHQRICTEHYYEEEDFVGNLFHRQLLPTCELSDVDQELKEAIAYLDIENLNIEATLKNAIVTRLEFRRQLLSAVQLGDIINSYQDLMWSRCLELLPTLKSTTHLGRPVEQSFSIKIQRRLASSVPPRPMVKISFEDAYTYLTKLCQYGKEAYRILDFHGGTHLLTFVWAFQSQTPQPSVYVRSLLQSLIFSQMKVLGTMSIKQLILDDLEEIVMPASPLIDPANARVEAPQDPRFQVLSKIDHFVTRAADPYLDMVRTICMNRSRLRRMLCHLVLEWDSLQFDAEAYDVEFRKYTKERPITDSESSNEEIWAFPLSSWAYYHKLRQMEWIIQMGFELDIYQTDELAGMYWYLQHIAGTRLQHIERIRTFITYSLARIPKPTLKQKKAFRRSISFLEFAQLEASATQSFADGLSCLFSFLSHVGLVPSPYHAMPYSTPSVRYSLRMRPFLSMSLPEVPSFAEFTSLVSLRQPEKNKSDSTSSFPTSQTDVMEQAFSILEVTDQALKIARKEWDAVTKTKAETARSIGCEDWWRSSVKNVLRSCITANIMVATAKKAMVNSGSRSTQDALSVEISVSEKNYNPWWIIPQITAK